jgi:hypothetical protein
MKNCRASLILSESVPAEVWERKVEELCMDDWQFGPAQELRRAFILDDTKLGPIHWYCPGKSAVIMTIDDIFPGTSQNAYEAGGDLESGTLGRLLWLLERHPPSW